MITQQNMGPSSARNTGIRLARFPFIAFLDADDEWKPDFLAMIKCLAGQYPSCGLYATAYTAIRPGNKAKDVTARDYPPGWHGIIDNYFLMCIKDQVVCSSSCAVRKTIFSRTGYFKESARRGEDLDMWARIALRSKTALNNTPGAIRHMEACRRTAVHTEPASFIFIKDALSRRNYPYLSEYTAKIQLIYCEHLLIKDRHKARDVLRSIKGTRIFYSRHRFFYIISFLPRPLIKSALFFRKAFFSVSRRIKIICNIFRFHRNV